MSRQIHRIFREYTDLVEPIAFDEAFLDVTRNKKGIPLAVDVARAVKRQIRDELGLVASAGVSYNKFLAKIASDYRKPDGLCTIHPDRAAAFIARLPIEAFWGDRPRHGTQDARNGNPRRRCAARVPPDFLTGRFGKAGRLYYEFAHGIDLRPVEASRVRKSVGCETTFPYDLTSFDAMTDELYKLAAKLNGRLDRAGFRGNTLTLKIKFADFRLQTRSLSPGYELFASAEIFPLATALLRDVSIEGHPVRLLGLSVGNPTHPVQHELYRQLSLDL